MFHTHYCTILCIFSVLFMAFKYTSVYFPNAYAMHDTTIDMVECIIEHNLELYVHLWCCAIITPMTHSHVRVISCKFPVSLFEYLKIF